MSTGPVSPASAATASFEVTSSLSRSAPSRPASFSASRSVAHTFAPSATNASAMARPMPAAAAVTSAVFPVSRPAMRSSSDALRHVDEPAILQLLHPLNGIAVGVIPAHVRGELFARVEAQLPQPERARPRLGAVEEALAEIGALRRRRGRDAPDQEMIGCGIEDQRAGEPLPGLGEPDLVIGERLAVVEEQRQRLDAEDVAVRPIGGALELAQRREVARPGQAKPERGVVPLERRGIEGAETEALSPGLVEVRRLEPALEGAPARRPFAVEHGIPGGVAVLALDHHVLAEHALEGEAEAARGALRGLVRMIALPLEAAVAELVEDVAGKEVDRLGRAPGLPEPRAEQEVAGLDHAVGRVEAHQRQPPLGTAGRLVDDGEEQRVLGRRRLVEPGLERGAVRKRPLGQIAQQRVRGWAGGEEVVAVAGGIDRLEADIAAVVRPALGTGPRRPLRKVGHRERSLRSSRKKPLSSVKATEPSKPAKLPSSAISFAARMKPVQAARESAEPTLMRRTPSAARSETVSPIFEPMSTFTGFGPAAATIAWMSSRLRGPGA